MRILITGSNGFVGGYLIKELVKKNHQIFAGVLEKTNEIEVEQFTLDITKPEQIKEALQHYNPNIIFHLAAQSNVANSWENPTATFKVNVIGTMNLVEAVWKYAPQIKLINIGSSEEYGLTAKSEVELSEYMDCKPQNPYAISKYTNAMNIAQLAKKHVLNYIHVRPFNHIGPGQSKGFVVSDFASQIAEIEKYDLEPIINVGNLDVYRDFLDVRDVVSAYVLLAESNVENGVYNISSGTPTRIRDILNELLSYSTSNIKVKIDNEKYRPAEVSSFSGNNTKLKNAVNWKSKHTLKSTLKDTLDWWREQVK